MRNRLSVFWKILTSRQRALLGLLVFVNTVSALCQFAFVSIMAPFISLAIDPRSVDRAPKLSKIREVMASSTDQEFLIQSGVLLIAIAIISSALLMIVHAGNTYFVWLLNREFSVRLLRSYLRQPLSFFRGGNSSELCKNLLVEVQNACGGFVLPALEFLSRALSSAFIIGLLLYIDTLGTVAILGTLSVLYVCFYRLTQARLFKLGRHRTLVQSRRFMIAMEVFSAIRDTKLHLRENSFLKRYSLATTEFCKLNASDAVLGQTPRLMIEAVVVVGLISFVIWGIQQPDGLAPLTPILTLYALAAYRIAPIAQQMFGNIGQIRANSAVADDLFSELQAAGTQADIPDVEFVLPFRRAIKLEHVNFSHFNSSAETPVLVDISMSISKGSYVAICGPTGCGKSTILDIVASLISPTSGTVSIDGQDLETADQRGWRRGIGYVSQDVVLLDGTISENIAFGIEPSEIDHGAVRTAAKLARIDAYIEQLPAAYDTRVGERGARLSGGQRQRLGIARALYRKPQVLLLDEATSALDPVTESEVISGIRAYGGERLTILSVTHRLTTARGADLIYVMLQGCVKATGTYDDLERSSIEFQNMLRTQVLETEAGERA